MDLSTSKIGGWNELQPINQMSLEKFIAEDLPWWWVGIPHRDPFLVTYYLEKRSESSDQDMNKLMLLREGLCVMIHCYRRQHSADFYRLHEHPGGPASRRELMMRKNVLCTRTTVQVEQSQDAVRITLTRAQNNWFVLKQFENQNCLGDCFVEYAQNVWERNCMHPEMQTKFFNTYPPKLIAKILKALREQLKGNDQLNAVEEVRGPVPEIPLEYKEIWKGGGGFWCGYPLGDLVFAARREEIEWVHSEGVYEIVPMQECIDSGCGTQKCLLTPLTNSIEIARKRIQDEEARQNSASITRFSVILCSTVTQICESVGLNHDVRGMVEQIRPSKIETL